MKHNQRGFVHLLLLAVIVSLLVVGGLTIWKANTQSDKNPTTNTLTDDQLDSDSTNPKPEAGYLNYSHTYEDATSEIDELSFKYPSNWVAVEDETSLGCTVELRINSADESQEAYHNVCVNLLAKGFEGAPIDLEEIDFVSLSGKQYTKKLLKSSGSVDVFMAIYIPKFDTPFLSVVVDNIPAGEFSTYEPRYEELINSITLE